jgi:release factor glutamine methyltransferase
MLVKDAILYGVAKLDNLPSPRLDTEILLAYVLDISRAKLLSELYFEIPNQQINDFQTLIDKRTHNIPVAYLVGNKSFMGLDFWVDENVLIPRPETESLVETAKKLIETKHLTKIFDVGTGCGNIAITLTTSVPHLKITASDVSAKALEVARKNAQTHEVESQITFIESHLATHIQDAELIIANLPYVPKEYEVMEDILHEPAIAVFGGDDGLNLYRDMFTQPIFNGFKGFAIIEFGERQYDSMMDWLSEKFADIKITTIKNIDGSKTGLLIDFNPTPAQ